MMNAIRHYVMVAHTGDLEPGTGKTVDANRMPVALFQRERGLPEGDRILVSDVTVHLDARRTAGR